MNYIAKEAKRYFFYFNEHDKSEGDITYLQDLVKLNPGTFHTRSRQGGVRAFAFRATMGEGREVHRCDGYFSNANKPLRKTSSISRVIKFLTYETWLH